MLLPDADQRTQRLGVVGDQHMACRGRTVVRGSEYRCDGGAGDRSGPNDLGMFASSGIGVAPANARPEIIAAADFATTTNDDGGVATCSTPSGAWRSSARIVLHGSDITAG